MSPVAVDAVGTVVVGVSGCGDGIRSLSCWDMLHSFGEYTWTHKHIVVSGLFGLAHRLCLQHCFVCVSCPLDGCFDLNPLLFVLHL